MIPCDKCNINDTVVNIREYENENFKDTFYCEKCRPDKKTEEIK